MSAATTTSSIPAPAQLKPRMRASSAPPLGLSARSARWRIASRQSAYPGWTPSALSAQKFFSAARNKGRQPNQPASATPSSTSAAPIPVNSRTRTNTSPTHAVTISGATPKIAAGSTIEAIQASASFGRLISARRLPAIARSDFCFGLEASSSASPSRGSRIGRAGSGARRSSPVWALEEMTSGARIAFGNKISGEVESLLSWRASAR